MSFDEAIENAVAKALVRALSETRSAPVREPDELLTLTEAARLAKVSESTVRQWLKAGLLKRYGSGRCIRLRREEVLCVHPKEERKRTAADVLEELEQGH